MKIRTTFYRNNDAGDAGGGLPPSLADLEATAAADAMAGNSNNNSSLQDPPAEGVNADGSLQDGYVKAEDGTISKKPADTGDNSNKDKPPVEGVNPDGTLQEGYSKSADGTIVKDVVDDNADDRDDTGNDDTGNTDAIEFWNTVNKLTGRDIMVEYPEGMDPISPEGVALREKAIREDEVEKFETHLQQTDPRAYAYMLHRASGKADTEFFEPNSANGYTLPDKDTLEESTDAQAAVYKYDLVSKGLSPEQADALVSMAVKDNKLKEHSLASYTGIEKGQALALKAVQDSAEESRKQFENSVTNFNNQVTGAIEKEIGFIVPDDKKQDFINFVMDNVNYQDGKFFIVQEIAQDKLKNQVESLLFQWNKGDMSKIVEKKAKTLATQRLRMGMNKEGDVSKKNGNAHSQSNGYVPLGQI